MEEYKSLGEQTIRAIKFKSLSDESQQQPNNHHANRTEQLEEANLHKRKQKKSCGQEEEDGIVLKKNFTLEYNYPAVIIDKLCFSVDRSQQQSNFLNECLYKLSNCCSFRSKFDQAASNKVEILKSINLNVPYGSIFGLLGPSSCGKTSLLRCLVGLLKANSGSVRLFGHDSRDSEVANNCCGFCGRTARSKSKVPGSNVGYMPQDLGLYEDFTIDQLLTMFGRYVGMPADLIETRIKFMVKFLDLPEVNRQISSLSGGQKRRVSFAVACLHMPPLIILDEPTVGVDPLLRQSIWKYLRRLADDENKTIIITTHYIEEAAQADQVALMRAGEILIQDTPEKIMQSNGSKTLEEAFLKICNNIEQPATIGPKNDSVPQKLKKLYPQPQFNWHDKLNPSEEVHHQRVELEKQEESQEEDLVKELQLKAQEKLALFDHLYSEKNNQALQRALKSNQIVAKTFNTNLSPKPQESTEMFQGKKTYPLKGNKLIISGGKEKLRISHKRLPQELDDGVQQCHERKLLRKTFLDKAKRSLTLAMALLYKNYRRNVNSIPLLVFQFLLPIIQMISFSLCVGGRPTNIGLGLVNLDKQPSLEISELILGENATTTTMINNLTSSDYDFEPARGSLSEAYLSFIDQSMLTIKSYPNLKDALEDVRKAKLWAAMEIGENFTATILRRFDLENFYQLDTNTIKQSVIKLYPDRSNKVLDMICHRSLVNSYREFLLNQFEHFKRLPIEVKEPIFDIKPNLISNSIDGYTESIAAGLLASLTYIMAAGLTTFIMVVERGNGILERTYTIGINPVAYILAHAAFRSIVMMLQVAVVLVLTFYVLRQPLVGSIWLAYLILMTLNLTGISYGLLISSLVTDQNGAALTIVSSLVVKITMSGILWPFEAIPRWLRLICYAQPLTMPVQALKAITLKGSGFGDSPVYLGFSVSIAYLVLFLTIASRRFKFYQH